MRLVTWIDIILYTLFHAKKYLGYQNLLVILVNTLCIPINKKALIKNVESISTLKTMTPLTP